MHMLAELAGFFAAHAVWCLSDMQENRTEGLDPIYASIDASGDRQMQRYIANTSVKAVATGRKRLAENPDKAQCAVLIFEGYMPYGTGKVDALILEMRDYAEEVQRITVAVPYALATGNSLFKVYGPKFLEFPSSKDASSFIGAFGKGVEDHPNGLAIWNAHGAQLK